MRGKSRQDPTLRQVVLPDIREEEPLQTASTGSSSSAHRWHNAFFPRIFAILFDNSVLPNSRKLLESWSLLVTEKHVDWNVTSSNALFERFKVGKARFFCTAAVVSWIFLAICAFYSSKWTFLRAKRIYVAKHLLWLDRLALFMEFDRVLELTFSAKTRIEDFVKKSFLGQVHDEDGSLQKDVPSLMHIIRTTFSRNELWHDYRNDDSEDNKEKSLYTIRQPMRSHSHRTILLSLSPAPTPAAFLAAAVTTLVLPFQPSAAFAPALAIFTIALKEATDHVVLQVAMSNLFRISVDG